MEEKIFGFMEKMYSDLTKRLDNMDNKIEKMDSKIEKMDNKTDTMSKQFILFENDLKPKVEAALDGYKQHTDILERIEKEVTRQEEIIMRRVK